MAWPHVTINYMVFLASGAMSVQTVKSGVGAIVKGKSPPLLLPSPLRGFVPVPRQLLCLPKGLDTVAQLAPTGP